MCTGFDKDGFDSTSATATLVVAYNIAEVDTDAIIFFFWGGGGSFGRSVAAKVGPCVQALVK